MVIHNLFCPHRNASCRHCSDEKIIRKTRGCRIDGKGEIVIRQEIKLGLYCNSLCVWINKVQECELWTKTEVVAWNVLEKQTGQTKII